MRFLNNIEHWIDDDIINPVERLATNTAHWTSTHVLKPIGHEAEEIYKGVKYVGGEVGDVVSHTKKALINIEEGIGNTAKYMPLIIGGVILILLTQKNYLT
jgi:hypothetical protein